MIRKLAAVGLAIYFGNKLLGRSAATAGRTATSGPGHAPTDLENGRLGVGERADEHFRPDPHGHIPPEDLEGLRPVTIKPGLTPAGYTS